MLKEYIHLLYTVRTCTCTMYLLFVNFKVTGNIFSSFTVPGDSLNFTCNSRGGGIYTNKPHPLKSHPLEPHPLEPRPLILVILTAAFSCPV